MTLESFLLAFIPLFVAIDPIGTLPLFLGLTQGAAASSRRRLAVYGVVTAFTIGIIFTVAGSLVFTLLGISPADFRVAGGLLLVVFSVRDVSGITPKTSESTVEPEPHVGAVPLGIPLIAGPAMLTTLLILNDERDFLSILLALVSNMLIVLVLFFYADRIIKWIGEATSRVIAKVVAIFLAAIGIMMIRKGIEAFVVR